MEHFLQVVRQVVLGLFKANNILILFKLLILRLPILACILTLITLLLVLLM